MTRRLGYVIIEWNQASGRPSVACDDLYETREFAEGDAQLDRDLAAVAGRKERFTVAEVSDEDDQ